MFKNQSSSRTFSISPSHLTTKREHTQLCWILALLSSSFILHHLTTTSLSPRVVTVFVTVFAFHLSLDPRSLTTQFFCRAATYPASNRFNVELRDVCPCQLQCLDRNSALFDAINAPAQNIVHKAQQQREILPTLSLQQRN